MQSVETAKWRFIVFLGQISLSVVSPAACDAAPPPLITSLLPICIRIAYQWLAEAAQRLLCGGPGACSHRRPNVILM